jgi:arylsulfate sulfotransferase
MNRKSSYCTGTFMGWLLVASAAAQAVVPPRARSPEMSVSLNPSIPSPAPVGTMMTWDASVSYASAGTLWYRFRARRGGDEFHMVRDYGPTSTLDWTAGEYEGSYEIEVSVKNLDTGESAVTYAVYSMMSRVNGGMPVISQTANPLVFLYSAPSCPVGSQMRVQFQAADRLAQATPYKPCNQDLSMNFYLAGMRPNTTYAVQHTVDTGAGLQGGPLLTLTTPEVSPGIAGYSVSQPQPAPATNGILLQSPLFQMTVATDLSGNLVWFYPAALSLTRPEAGGFFWGFLQDPSADPSRQILRKFDLAGTTIRETNSARISEQLVAMGKRPITAFHHEARSLPDGKVLALAATEQILTDVQGPGPVDVLGDMILVLDADLQVVWAWDAFDHLDPYRLATLRETCTAASGGCPPFYLAPQANDWLHGNSLQLTPDGNILYSVRHQDWVIEIDYNLGGGSGDILWRLGKDGDFQFDSADSYPWFSHQHDPGFVRGDNSILMLFDNGNVRYATDASADSRGQVLLLDGPNRVATLVLNADLGGYSFALGAAQALPNSDYHFDLGILPGNTSQSVEVDPSGKIVYALQAATPLYRTFRMETLYTP